MMRASPKRADSDMFFTVLPARAGEERDMVVAAIALLTLELCGLSVRWLERA